MPKTRTATTTPPGERVTLEGPGRYAVYQVPGGDWLIARATGICDTCKACGCGEQAEPVKIPAMVIQMARRTSNKQLLGMLRAAGRT